MSLHRAQAQHQRARWRLLVLAPFWALQVVLTLTQAGLFAYRLGDSMEHYKEKDVDGKHPTIELAWEVNNIVLSAVAALCTFFEIARYLAESLTPWTMLFTHVVKLTCASAILALDIVVYVRNSDEHYSLAGLGIDAVLLLTALVLSLYSIHTYRRLSRFDDHPHTINVKTYGFNDEFERSSSSSSDEAGWRPALQKGLSFNSGRKSFSTIRSVDVESAGQETGIQRTPSYYRHERDTQFDAYVARRRSESLGKAELEDILRRDSFDSGTTTPPRPMEAKVLIGCPRTLSHTRNPSNWSDHVLIAVPEEEDEGKVENVKKALLSNSKRQSEDNPRAMQEVDLAEPNWARKAGS